MICPKCRYKRKPIEAAPDWQCPSCGVAYSKATSSTVNKQAKITVTNQYGKTSLTQRLLNISILLSLLLYFLAIWQKDSLPQHSDILKSSYQDPLQSKTRKRPFSFFYRGETYDIQPVAKYELWGLVVTKNNINSWADIMHTDASVDIKDICVIWGENVANSDYKKVKFSSGDFTCYFQYPHMTVFNHNKISNNHLLSDDAVVRHAIRQVKIGDQVHVKGMLVNYSPRSNPEWRRVSSTVRTDTGNGACEVLFVNQFDILRSKNGGWYTLASISKWLFLILLVVKITLIIMPNKPAAK